MKLHISVNLHHIFVSIEKELVTKKQEQGGSEEIAAPFQFLNCRADDTTKRRRI